MRNAQTVINWLKLNNVNASQLKKCLIGITANPEAAEAFGIAPENIYPFGIGSVVASQYGQPLASRLPSSLALLTTNNF
jgi:hypothetical protein